MDAEHKSPSDEALLLRLDDHIIKRHSFNPWNTSGAYCDVFLGDHPKHGKVALKRPRMSGDTCTDRQLESFMTEGRLWRTLRHRNVLEFVGMTEAGGVVWLVSVFAENGTLLEYIRRYPDVDRHDLIYQFTSGLAYLHSNGVVHGDLKSPNLLISAAQILLISDFGLSKLSGTPTTTSKKGVGSFPWMAPELFGEASKTYSSDVYAYGITISEILRAESPFNQLSSLPALIKAIMENKRPPKYPLESPQGASYETLWDVAEQCWDPEPPKRPAMAAICGRFGLGYVRMADDTVQTAGVPLIQSPPTGHRSPDRPSTFTVQQTMSPPYVNHVHSEAKMTSFLTEKSIVVVGFHAAWSTPSRAITSFYSQLASKYRIITFVKFEVDLDNVGSVGQKYRLTALPTFIMVKNKEEIDRIRGPDWKGLEDVIVKHAPQDGPADSGSGYMDGIEANDSSLLGYLDVPQVNCLNESRDHTLKSIVEQKTRNTSEAYLESDADEQLLLTLTFNQVVKIRSLVLHTRDPKFGPKNIKIDTNNLALGFDDVESATEPAVVQVLEVSEDSVKEGKQIRLRFVRLQRVRSLHIFVGSNHGDEIVTRIDAIDVYGPCDGQPATNTQIGGLRNFLETHQRGMDLLRLFEGEGGIQNLSKSVLFLREALLLCPAGNQHHPVIVSDLAVALLTQYEQQGNYSDLTEIIPLGYELLELRPPGHPHRGSSLNNLSNALLTRYQREGSLDDLSEATEGYREALELHPVGHPDRAQSLSSLSRVLLQAIDPASDAADMQGYQTLALEVLEALREAAGLPSCPPRHRLKAALKWIDAAGKSAPESTLDAYWAALDLLDIILATSSTAEDKRIQLSSSKDFARCKRLGVEAASYAVSHGHVARAIDLLERRRDLLFAQVGRYRVELEELRKANAELADRFSRLSGLLDASVVSNQPTLEGRT